MSIPKKLIKSSVKIPSAKPSDTLNSALSQVKSSHDPVFIMNKGRLEGIVSASYALFKKRFPLNTKAITASKKPPRIDQSTSLHKVAEQMLSMDVYTLPIYGENETLKGIINAKDIIAHLKNELDIFKNIAMEDAIIRNANDKIRDIYTMLKKDTSSRVVIVDNKGKIEGLVTRRDIQEAFMNPPVKDKSIRTKNNRTFLIEDKDLKKFDFTLGEYMKKNVVTIAEKANISDILDKILKGKYNSVILVDRMLKPRKIATIKSLLKAVSLFQPEEKVVFTLTDHHKVLLQDEKRKVTEIALSFASKLGRSQPIDLIKSEVNAYFNKKNKITGFEFHAHVDFKDGKKLTAKVEDKVLWNAVKKAFDKVKNQLKRQR